MADSLYFADGSLVHVTHTVGVGLAIKKGSKTLTLRLTPGEAAALADALATAAPSAEAPSGPSRETIQRRIVAALWRDPTRGISRTEIYRLFNGRVTKRDVSDAVGALAAAGTVHERRVTTGGPGRPPRRIFLGEASEEP